MAVNYFRSQWHIYRRLRQLGSSWSKAHVVYADYKVVVLNKPPDLVCQLSHSTSPKSKLEHASLDSVFEDISNWYPPPVEPHTVHRLDKMTTGCLIIPVSHPSAKAMAIQFQQGTVKKTYLALVRGGKQTFSTAGGEVNDPILYSDGRAEIHGRGKTARTGWKLLSSSPKAPVSLLELDLITGNKHQLRIHLSKVLQAPILGDSLYSRKPVNETLLSMTAIPEDRLFLHSAQVSFFNYHTTGKRHRLSISAPPPKDFKRICGELDIEIPHSFCKTKVSVEAKHSCHVPQLWKDYDSFQSQPNTAYTPIPLHSQA